MAEPAFDVTVAHRWFAVETNNAAWALIEQEVLTTDQALLLVDLAHTSAYHWRQVGSVVNEQRAAVLLANAYAAAGNPEAAVLHAKRSLAIGKSSAAELADWDVAFALDAAARAYAVAGTRKSAASYRVQAREAGDAIADAEDRAVFDAHFAQWPWRDDVS
jgi:hypothetical protein